MSIRTTVTLDDDVLARVKRESQARGASFRETLNEVLRAGLTSLERTPTIRSIRIDPTHMGIKPGLSYDNIEALIEFGEGEHHR